MNKKQERAYHQALGALNVIARGIPCSAETPDSIGYAAEALEEIQRIWNEPEPEAKPEMPGSRLTERYLEIILQIADGELDFNQTSVMTHLSRLVQEVKWMRAALGISDD